MILAQDGSVHFQDTGIVGGSTDTPYVQCRHLVIPHLVHVDFNWENSPNLQDL